ncbi:unnamed protein product [Schistosoma rodhaini]|uniref:Cytochrome-c oxidase n=1 Tax=Schistosoma mansoni TaxID=6183 RepID=G4VS06_SCHMA|nr:cytochrome-c oxidase [Schistosoma mansoni]CAH8666384.1 unnamed protein product [Schistosoma rodhaini]|eukprot:XP_018654366.1 cytochrome-c oxidase [Schistosoma mansoni]
MVLRTCPVYFTLCRRATAAAVAPKDSCSVLSPLEQKFYPQIGNREIVGFGRNGIPMYYDDLAYPYPSIRFRNHTPEIAKLREKEQGDWSKLTTEEVKTLYRHSFQRTFAELAAPNGQWKLGLAYGLIFISIGLSFYIYIRTFVVIPPKNVLELPEYKDAVLYKKVFSRSGSIGDIYKFDISKMRWREE